MATSKKEAKAECKRKRAREKQKKSGRKTVLFVETATVRGQRARNTANVTVMALKIDAPQPSTHVAAEIKEEQMFLFFLFPYWTLVTTD